jgi:tetratricopeptide (TPR) repeat protein
VPFPDGQMYVDLRGFEPSGSVMSPAEALGRFLDAFGVPADCVPASVEARVGLYRSLLAGRRVLVVLDNARDADQVRPLLPGTPGCMVVVTSRDQLTGLVAAEGAVPLTLDLLTRTEARGMLARRLGEDRVAAEPAAVDEIIDRCARLPLALAVVAARAATHPGFPLATLAEQVRDTSRNLAGFAGTDTATDVGAVFSWSYQALSRGAAGLFRLLGLHPCPDITAPAAASLGGTAVEDAGTLLAELARTHQVSEHAPGRYSMHDLLRADAATRSDAEDNHQQRQAALGRLYDYYLEAAVAAMRVLYPAEPQLPRSSAPPTASVPTPAGAEEARAWLNAERPALTSICVHAASHGRPRHATDLSTVLFRYLENGYYTDGLIVHSHALQAARQTGDLAAEAQALTHLGNVQMRLGHYDHAAGHHREALALFQRLDDRAGQARALHHLGTVEWRCGRYHPAAGHFRHALTLFGELADVEGQGRVLNSLGIVDMFLGRDEEAFSHYERALTLNRQIGNTDGEARVLNNLGGLQASRGHYEQATDSLERALALARRLGSRYGEAETLTNLADIHTRQGRHDKAIAHLEVALALFRETGERYGETCALNRIAEALHAAGQPTRSVTHHTAALTIARSTGDREEQARAHAGLGQAHCATGHRLQAHRHYQHALALYSDLSSPRTTEIAARLAGLGSTGAGPATATGTTEP